MATAALVIGTVISAGAAVKSSREQSKARRAQERLRRVRERRERARLFAEQKRAQASVEVGLGARGASASSAAAGTLGSIATQGAAEQGFLNTVSTISGQVNAFQAAAQRAQDIGQLSSTLSGGIRTGIQEGAFNFLKPKTTEGP